jgi:hypothetical protein
LVLPIAELWWSRDEALWAAALERYWQFIQPGNLELERAMDRLDPARIRGLAPDGWLAFLCDEYFRWKYTAANRYATTTGTLNRATVEPAGLAALFVVKERLLIIDPSDVGEALRVAMAIPGLGTAGASGLWALLYPRAFGTVDQFVVKALRTVPSLPQAPAIALMRPEGLRVQDAEVLIGVMRRQARELNLAFATEAWTPRAIDKVLWTYGRSWARGQCRPAQLVRSSNRRVWAEPLRRRAWRGIWC